LNGDRAVYKGGKRVTNVKKPAVSKGSSSRSNPTPPPDPPKPSFKQALSIAERKKLQKGRTNWVSGARRDTVVNKGAEGPKPPAISGKEVWDDAKRQWVRVK